jgi:hypothetical protein
LQNLAFAEHPRFRAKLSESKECPANYVAAGLWRTS